jgi:hypothetical protein
MGLSTPAEALALSEKQPGEIHLDLGIRLLIDLPQRLVATL